MTCCSVTPARCRSRTPCFMASAVIRSRSRFTRWDRAGRRSTGVAIGLPLAMLLALAIGLFLLRVEAIFFAMITLAVASAFLGLASQLSWLTRREDGPSLQPPEMFRPGPVPGLTNVFRFRPHPPRLA